MFTRLFSTLFAGLVFTSFLLLSGCGLGTTAPLADVPGAALHGTVHGGQNPVSGAHVYLLAASNSGYGTASTSLLTGTGNADTLGGYVLTDSFGGFALDTVSGSTVTYNYTCPGSDPQVYLYATGGNSGAGTNSAVGLLAALGPCSNLNSSTSVVVNEVTTVASAFAMAGYSTDATHISSSATPLAANGIANAFANTANLVNLQGGYAYATTPAGNGTVPRTTVDTLANILAACVNSADTEDGGGNFLAYSGNCNTLLTTATSNGIAIGTTGQGTAATDTATAAINIAHYPGSNLVTLYDLPTGTPPFAPALSGVNPPIDFILGIQYTGAGLNYPAGIAIDASGNAWIANYQGNTVTELTNAGTLAAGEPSTGFTSVSLNNPTGLAVDTTGNIWIANFSGASLTELGPTGSTVASTNLGLGTASGGTAVAVGSAGNVWITSPTTNSVARVNQISYAVATYSPSGLAGPTGITLDARGNVWVTNSSSSTNNLIELTGNGALVSGETPAGISGGGLSTPFSVAVDSSGDIWATDPDNGVTKLLQSGTTYSFFSSPYTGGALNNPEGIAIDGSGNVWVADEFSNKNVTEMSNTGALVTGENPTEGYVGGDLNFPAGIAIDGSGDVWVTNGDGVSVTELIGVATPVVTPLASALVTPYTPASMP